MDGRVTCILRKGRKEIRRSATGSRLRGFSCLPAVCSESVRLRGSLEFSKAFTVLLCNVRERERVYDSARLCAGEGEQRSSSLSLSEPAAAFPGNGDSFLPL